MLEAYYSAKPIFKEMPLHPVTDRVYWDRFRTFTDVIKEDCPEETVVLPATQYMDYYFSGNRIGFQSLYFANRKRLTCLTLLEAVENDGRYVTDIIDCVWEMLGEVTWTLPAHNSGRDDYPYDDALPDPEHQALDLFQAESGAILAFVYFLMGDKFDEYSKVINKRIVNTLYDRIIKSFNSEVKWWWTGELGNRVNNWNPWIIWNVTNVALVLKEDSVFQKAARLLENYVKSVYEDGGCDEGPSYWFKAGAALIYAVENLRKATGIDISDEEMLKNCSEFNIKANLFDNVYANFSDATPKLNGIKDYLKISQILRNAKLYEFTKANYKNISKGIFPYAIHECIDELEARYEFEGKELSAFEHENSYYVESIQVKTIHKDGFDVAIKGGHNKESHNHNDVGNFIIAKDKELFLIDTGSMDYCKETFSENRYTIWVNRSEYHNLPEIGGSTQKNGREFEAKSLSHGESRFEADISGAYGDDNIVFWKRKLSVEGGVSVTESYEYRKPTSSVLHFMTSIEPKAENGGLSLTAESGKTLKMEFDGSFSVDTISTGNDSNLNKNWGKTIYRINIPVNESISGEFKYRFI